jgi:ankyrin repeat protein
MVAVRRLDGKAGEGASGRRGEMDEWYERERLHRAAGAGDLNLVKSLVAEGCDLNAFDDIGWTPLHHAAREEHLHVAAFLLESGAQVDARREALIGDTPLGTVAGECSLDMARLLVAAGADPTICGWMGLNALHRAKARRRGDGPLVHALLAEAAARRRG